MDYKQFMEEADLIPPKKLDEESKSLWPYLWDEYEKKSYQKRMQDLVEEGNKIYTLVDEEGESHILEGFWRVNRMGYLISSVDVPIGEFSSVEVTDIDE
jgi:hypothetical protein